MAYVPLHVPSAQWPTTSNGHSSDDVAFLPSQAHTRELAHDDAAITLCQRGTDTHAACEYTTALENHRGCGQCWLRWEARQVEQAAQVGEPPDLAVKCPVCHMHVIIRRGYDAVLCRSCQREIIASGGELKLFFARCQAFARHFRMIIGLCVLCAVFGVQALVSTLLWLIAEDQIDKATQGSGNASPTSLPSAGLRAGMASSGDNSSFSVYGFIASVAAGSL